MVGKASDMNIAIAAAKARLAEIVRRVERGEEIVLTRHGRPVARVVPPARQDQLPRIGALKGQIRIADDFDEPLEDFGEYTV